MVARRIVVLVLLAACGRAVRTHAQELLPPATVAFPEMIRPIASGQPTFVPMNEVELSFDELVTRLRAAEARIDALESGDELPIEWPPAESSADDDEDQKWYEKYSIRGYAQFRINEVVRHDEDGAPPHHVGDASVADHQNFLIRRARLVLYGDVSEHVYIYIQPDFAVTPPGSPDANHFVQLRDWYADIYCDTDKIHRFRVGQSKVPYGWENLQSSQNRLPLDRHDALNSAVRNERDLGVFYYWTPEYVQDAFSFISDEGLKGSGNYGMFGLGVYNGQGGSFIEQNDNVHVVSRLTYPFVLYNGQIVELGVQGYTGRYVVLSTPISPLGIGAPVRPLGTLETGDRRGIQEERIAWSAIYYPQPFGFQTEWTVGRGPALDETQTIVEDRALYGGYVMAMYRRQTRHHGEWWPFVRWAYYKGGYKSERNAPFSRVNELEFGVEWQITSAMEFVMMYTLTDRTNTRAVNEADQLSYRQFDGDILRFQFQVNY